MLSEALRQLSRIFYTIVSSLAAVGLVKWSSIEVYGEYSKIFLLIIVINSLRELGLQSKFYHCYTKDGTEHKEEANIVVILMSIFFIASLIVYVLICFLLGFKISSTIFLSQMLLIPFCQILLSILSDYFDKMYLNIVFNFSIAAISAGAFIFSIQHSSNDVMDAFSKASFLFSVPLCVYIVFVFFKTYSINLCFFKENTLSKSLQVMKSYSSSNISYSVYQRLVPFVVVCFLSDTQAAFFSVATRLVNLLNEPVSIYFSGRGAKLLFKNPNSKAVWQEICTLYIFYFLTLIIFFGLFFKEILDILNLTTQIAYFGMVFVLFLTTFLRALNSLFSCSIIASGNIKLLARVRKSIAVLSLLFSCFFYLDVMSDFSLHYLFAIECIVCIACLACIFKGNAN